METIPGDGERFYGASPKDAASKIERTRMKITFIGGGVMAEAILGGILDAGVAGADEIRLGEPVAERRTMLSETYGVAASADNLAVIEGANIVVLAVKPQHLNPAMESIRTGLRGDQTVLSIVAGATLETMSKGLDHQALVRVMPNTPARIGEGMTVWTAADEVTDGQKADSRRILASFGEEIYVEDEKYIDMATALSASGPAYVFLFIEALIDAGVYMGLQRPMARKLVLQTVLGSAKYVQETGSHTAELKDMVSSPAGGTVEALMSFEKSAFRGAVLEAVDAAYRKYRALEKNS